MVFRLVILSTFISWLVILFVNFEVTFKCNLQLLVVVFMICYFTISLYYHAKVTFDSEFVHLKRFLRKKEKIEIKKVVRIELNNRNTMPPGASQYVLKYINNHDECKTILFDIDDVKLDTLLFYLKEKGKYF